MMISGNTDLRGITSLMNPDTLKPNIDLMEVEKDMIGTEEHEEENTSDDDIVDPDNPISIYSRDISLLKHELGIELDDKPSGMSHPKKPVSSRKPPKRPNNPSIADLVAELDLKIDLDSIQPGRKEPSGKTPPSRKTVNNRRGSDGESDSSAGSRQSERSNASRESRSSRPSRRGRAVRSVRDGPRPDQRARDISRIQSEYERRNTRPPPPRAQQSPRRYNRFDGVVERSRIAGSGGTNTYDPQLREKSRYLDRKDQELAIRNNDYTDQDDEPDDGQDGADQTEYGGQRSVLLPPDSKYIYRRDQPVLKPLDYPQPGQYEDDPDARIADVMNEFTEEVQHSYSAIEKQNERTLKQEKIEEIRQLKLTLIDEGVNCDAIVIPKEDDTMGTIDSTLYTLQLKLDRTHYSTMAESLVTGFVETVVEGIFDGKRSFPLIGAPDYTDYHKTVSMKMYRMRHQTSQVVGRVIQKYNIGPMARIFLELVPSVFTYPKERRKRQQSRSGLSNDPSFNDNIRKIRASDYEKDVQDLEDIE